jgi:hypothetical protein
VRFLAELKAFFIVFTLGAGMSLDQIEKWIADVRECKFLPEQDLKLLCELVKEFLLGILWLFFFFVFLFFFLTNPFSQRRAMCSLSTVR